MAIDPTRPPGSNPSVLLVDDDPAIVRGAQIRLRALGFITQAAGDGVAGLDAAIECPPDAILLDIRMPRMDGLTMLAELRRNEITSRIPVVMVSVDIGDDARKCMLELGAKCFIEKPFQARDLLRALYHALTGA